MNYKFLPREIIVAKLRRAGFIFNNCYGTVYPKQDNPPLLGIVDKDGNFLYVDEEN